MDGHFFSQKGNKNIALDGASRLYDLEAKFVRFGARDYDAESGRRTAKNPIRFEGGDTNLYNYSGQDPIIFKDIDGNMKFPADPKDLTDGWEQDKSHKPPGESKERISVGSSICLT